MFVGQQVEFTSPWPSGRGVIKFLGTGRHVYVLWDNDRSNWVNVDYIRLISPLVLLAEQAEEVKS